MMKLYAGGAGRSPYARKVRIVLAEKGLETELNTSMAADLPEDYRAMNPNLLVPLLIDGERQVFESNVILDYLLQTYPKNTAPQQPPLAPAMTRPEHHWEDQAVLSTIEIMLDRNVSLTNLARSGLDTAQVPYLQRDERRIQSCLDWLEPLATPEGFAPGMFSIMDVNLIAAFTSMESRKPGQWKGRPSLEAIYERYQTRPSVADTFPPPA